LAIGGTWRLNSEPATSRPTRAIVAGSKTSEIFIENGRFHGQLIAADLSRKLR